MRKLASIQRIHDIEPIEGADRIEKAKVEGWPVVIPKGQFREGDKVVFFEVDSFLPIRECYSFLKSSFKNNVLLGDGYKIRTQKMKGELSQGLCMRLEELGITPATAEGTDLTEVLGVKEWEIPERATTGETAVGLLPVAVPHTDETRYQVYPEWKDEFKGKRYYISTKMDGSSHSVSFDQNGFHICGHNYEYKDDGMCSFYEYIKKQGLKQRVEDFCKKYGLRTLTIQGEYCGPGIQKNRMKLTQPKWFVFTIMEDSERVDLFRMEQVCVQLALNTVPIEEIGNDLPSVYPTDEDLQKRSDGQYITDNKEVGRKEGIVIRPVKPEFSESLKTYLSMKVVNNNYLWKNE